jgi:hypothetical protein
MIPLTDELDALSEELRTGLWTPSPVETEAAQNLADLAELTTSGIRKALHPARKTRSRLVMSFEKVASVLSLPQVHEEADSRLHLLTVAQRLAREIATTEM